METPTIHGAHMTGGIATVHSAPATNGITAANGSPAVNGDRPAVSTICLIILTVCVAGAVLTVLRSVITPVLIGLFLFFLIEPVVAFFKAQRVPTWMTYLVIGLWAAVAVYGLGWFVQTQVEEFRSQLKENYPKLMDVTLTNYARQFGLVGKTENFEWRNYGFFDLVPISQEDLFGRLLGMSLEALESSALAVFYLIFMLIDARRFSWRTQNTFETDSASKMLSMLERMKVDIRRFVVVKTAVSVGLGLTTALIGFLFGLDFWPLWGFLMFLANYVTYIGSIAALAPPIAIAFLLFPNPAMAGGLAATLIAVRFVWIDYVEIRYSGMHVNVSPLLLLFSLALLGWMWGVVGMLLAVPLVTSLRIALASNPETAYLARMMSDDDDERPGTETVGV